MSYKKTHNFHIIANSNAPLYPFDICLLLLVRVYSIRNPWREPSSSKNVTPAPLLLTPSTILLLVVWSQNLGKDTVLSTAKDAYMNSQEIENKNVPLKHLLIDMLVNFITESNKNHKCLFENFQSV